MWQMMWPWMMGGLWAGPWVWLATVYAVVSAVAVLWALIDLSHAKKDAGYKLIWAAIAFVLGPIGVLLYYLVEKTKTEKRTGRR